MEKAALPTSGVRMRLAAGPTVTQFGKTGVGEGRLPDSGGRFERPGGEAVALFATASVPVASFCARRVLEVAQIDARGIQVDVDVNAVRVAWPTL